MDSPSARSPKSKPMWVWIRLSPTAGPHLGAKPWDAPGCKQRAIGCVARQLPDARLPQLVCMFLCITGTYTMALCLA